MVDRLRLADHVAGLPADVDALVADWPVDELLATLSSVEQFPPAADAYPAIAVREDEVRLQRTRRQLDGEGAGAAIRRAGVAFAAIELVAVADELRELAHIESRAQAARSLDGTASDEVASGFLDAVSWVAPDIVDEVQDAVGIRILESGGEYGDRTWPDDFEG